MRPEATSVPRITIIPDEFLGTADRAEAIEFLPSGLQPSSYVLLRD
jgi:hypothetical protein